MTQQQKSGVGEAAKEVGSATIRVAIYVVLYVLVSAVARYIFVSLFPSLGLHISEYEVYVQILLAVAFGYLIVSGVAQIVYASLKPKYGHPAAAATRNIIKIVGVGALAAAIAGGIAGGAAGVALGGFIGIVIGFASQQVLGQAIAGLFLLIARPFKIGDSVVLVGEDGEVLDVATLFTTVMKADGVRVLIPNSSIISSKIYIKTKK
ncbi:MAG: mechanosensitive ion channel [Ignisphaera sp.]|nr:mechanosensitive ion channel family protein [Ignisphaera sp.]MDW8084749.1 mechanosensitive ion channel [Ignisphaera sp.]